jgi:small subunit ribosomal protein SAe
MATNPLALTESDLKLMLAAKVHLGTRNVDPNMERYIWKRRDVDGLYLINLGKTWEKLVLAARIIVAIENPQDVIVVSARPYGQRAVFKYAQHTGSAYIGGRYTPGTFTNQINKKFLEPRLLVVTDPQTDHQPLKESSYVNIPTIAFCSTDAPLKYVDVAIPCNNKSREAIALMYWMLAREVNRMRAAIKRDEAWNVMVDLFMHREVEEVTGRAGDEREDGRDDTRTDGAAAQQPAHGTATGVDPFDNTDDVNPASAEAKADWEVAATGATGAAPAGAAGAAPAGAASWNDQSVGSF